MGVLARSKPGRLEARLATLGARPDFEWLRRPETGAVMTRGRAGGSGRMFSLGEMSVTRCALKLVDAPDVVGHAYVQGRDAAKAEAAALSDALLQTARHDEVMAAVVEPLRAEEQARRLNARQKAGATKVDFFTMVRAEGA